MSVITHRDTIVPEAGGIFQVLPVPSVRGVAIDLWSAGGQVAGHAHTQLTAAETLELICRLEQAISVENVPAGWRGVRA